MTVPPESAPLVSPATLAPVLDFLRRHAPFSRMAPADLEFLASRARLGFYAAGEVILDPAQGPAQTFYIVKQGRVRGEAEQGTTEGAWELHEGECFPIGALVSQRPVRMRQRAAADTFCFELGREDFSALLERSLVFRDFCSRRIANLLDQALRGMQQSLASEVSGAAALSAPLANLVRRAPVTCAPQQTIRAALEQMHREHVGSIAITDAEARPLGVFTLHDLLRRVVQAGLDLDHPMGEVMTPAPYALPPQSSAYEAALLMARQGFGHLCVVENEKLVGVISERDLFSLQRIGLVNLSRSIARAGDITTLARLGHDTYRLIDQMLVQGASVAQLAQIITLINDHITRRVIALCVQQEPVAPVAFTWLSFGSEGRNEQTLKTDQDNGMLFMAASAEQAEAARRALLPLARRINEALAACGYPLCPGNIMASNPACCLSFSEWQERFAVWIDQGTPEHLLNASIYFDFRPLYGDETLAEELRANVLARVGRNPRFLRQMAENALRNRPPLGMVRDFVVAESGEHINTIDLKLNGTTPFVDAARLLALANGISETNTLNRLHAVVRAGKVDAAEAEAWCDAYEFIQLLRMRHHQEQARADRPLDNHVDPEKLNELDRRILKESFRQARKLQARIALDYQL